MKIRFIVIATFYLFSGKIISQTNNSNLQPEILEYVSATFDPASEECQILFKNLSNQNKIFYYSKQDSLKIEEQFFNSPVYPITNSNLNLTKTELVGKKYKITYIPLTVNATDGCCFKMQSSELSE